MEKFKGTKGEWEFLDDIDYVNIHGIWSKEEFPTYIARTCYAGASLENAQLIAAAPELLAACMEFVRKCECGEARSKRSYAQMKAAINKALGNKE